jgi:hypothetical protein
MGLIPRLRELGYQVRELRFVDREGRTSASMSVDALARIFHGSPMEGREGADDALVLGCAGANRPQRDNTPFPPRRILVAVYRSELAAA